MAVKECKICGLEVEYENEDELSNKFYKKKTYTGDYYLNTCKECEKAKHRDKYKSGEYNWWRKRKLDVEDYSIDARYYCG